MRTDFDDSQAAEFFIQAFKIKKTCRNRPASQNVFQEGYV
jgi:hypothetical protein